MNGASRLVIVGALVVFGAFGLAASLFVAGDAAAERLGLLFALFGSIVAALIAALRSDAAAVQTARTSDISRALDGAFEHRVRSAVRDVRDEPASSTAADDTRPTSSTITRPPESAPFHDDPASQPEPK